MNDNIIIEIIGFRRQEPVDHPEEVHLEPVADREPGIYLESKDAEARQNKEATNISNDDPKD